MRRRKSSRSQHDKPRVWFIVRCVCAVTTLVAIGYWLTGWHVRASAADTLQAAEEHLRERDNAGARETLKWLLWFEPDQHRALLITGISLNADKRFPEAIEVLDRIPEDSESLEQKGIALASSLIEDGQLERAESVLKRQLARFPRAGDAHNRLVRLYLRRLRERDATALLIDHWRRYPDDLSVLPDLLELEANRGTPQEHVGKLEAADRAHPNQASVVLALARAYSLMGMTEQARNRFQAALELRPNDSDTRILAAEFFLDSGELETAESLLTAKKGSGLVYRNGPVGASHKRVLTPFSPPDDRYWFLRCRIAEQTGNAGDAYADLQRAMALRPNEETYVLMQAALLRRMGRVDQAAQAAIEATQLAEDRKQLFVLSDQLDRDRPDPAHCLAIADLLERLGHPEQAAGWRLVHTAVAPSEAENMFFPPPRVHRDAIENNAP